VWFAGALSAALALLTGRGIEAWTVGEIVAGTGQVHTAHTTNLVPFVYYGRRAVTMVGEGVLSDVAPSLLALMDVPQPKEMTGRSLLRVG
jgi:bisphosphoglycerate-independent phosphoglycerate mutase (AlkP superfamily)